ncbi:hypothetical protein FK178_10310 [Antarcticibacterium arcticum]|uniref:DoxX family protein n=1 Tax=Antarcticibacterium arcticum TaxID=2585771 RepID=A0A5B8YJH7_9FLAO|nr:hypothetical protein [Antarcticibacterium arcticum]QED38092.1 hypothetical protein FK178_10310 [Antarcticibacterium arcticum]
MSETKTGKDKILSRILIWLPSLVITLFYIPNALDKLINHDQTGKIVESSAVMITAGVFILIGVALFLYNKTILIGTSMLVLYMTFIVLIHMYKGKPSEIVMLILMSTIFASYIRKPYLFHQAIEKQGRE